jgi:class 3 adenylate cyclase
VLLSATVYERVSEFVEVEEIGGIQLKGIDQPMSAYALKGISDEA